MVEFVTDFDSQSRFLESCDLPLEQFVIEPFRMVIFGGAGDLSQRKLLPTLFHIFLEGELPDEYSVFGAGIPTLTDEQYRTMMEKSCRTAEGGSFDEEKWKEFRRHLFYVGGAFDDDRTYEGLKARIPGGVGKKDSNSIYYLAVPPDFTPLIVEKLNAHRLSKGDFKARVIVEKPFGRDRETAVKLNRILNSAFDETQIYRIDHYLGKETVQNIIFFRFANTIFERLWNSQYIDNVQITVAENIGIEHRGAFYERAGVVRDIVQNHIMQLVGLVAMEPPIGFEAEFIRDEKVKIFRSIRPLAEGYIDAFTVRGQYGAGTVDGREVPGYRSESKVAPDSNTPTFMAAKLNIANWRWAGVPFYVRTGKRLARRTTEICIQFKQPPLKLFGRTCDVLEPNILVLAIQPDEKISLRFGVKYPYASNQIYHVRSQFSYRETFREDPHPAYERLLVDCMKGDLTLFVRQDGVEAMWEVVDPLIARWESVEARNFPNYAAGSWGPEEANVLLEREGRRWLTS